jgi:hypothetical protein
MLPIDLVHAVCLMAVAAYIWGREPPRLLLTPLMLVSFFVLYGVGNIIYFAGAEDIDARAHTAVTTCLILMWFSLIVGIELARAGSSVRAAAARLVIRRWKSTPLANNPDGSQLLALVGIIVAGVIFGIFLYLGKPSQLQNFLSLDLSQDKVRYRADFASGGGYVYQTLIISIAPFISFLLLMKGIATKQRYLFAIGLLVCAAVFAGKLGTFEKIPWLVYLLQLMAVFQLPRRLEFGIGRVLIFLVVVAAGAAFAAHIALPDLDSGSIIEWLGYRFFEVNNEVVYQTLYVYPRYLPHAWGMNIGLIHSLFGSGELLSAHARVANFFGADGATFDSFFIGDAWVDFSYGGVVAISLIVGYVVKTFDIFVLSLGKTPLALALLGSGMYGLYQLQVTSAFTAFLSGGLLFIPLFAFASAALFRDLYRRPRSQAAPALQSAQGRANLR